MEAKIGIKNSIFYKRFFLFSQNMFSITNIYIFFLTSSSTVNINSKNLNYKNFKNKLPHRKNDDLKIKYFVKYYFCVKKYFFSEIYLSNK